MKMEIQTSSLQDFHYVVRETRISFVVKFFFIDFKTLFKTQ